MSTKFNKRQLPDSTVYNDEETTFQAKVLLPIATPTDDKEAITFKFYKDKREEIDTEISLLKNPDRITVNAGYTLLGQDLTFNPDWKVVIDAVEYTNTAQVILNFPLASAGYSRLDLVAFTKDSTFVRVAGVESLTTPVVPTTPPDTVYITVVFVSDVSVNEPISSVHNPVTIGTANGLGLSTQQLSLGLASSSTTGALSDTDWNTFNGKVGGTGTNNFLTKWSGTNTVNASGAWRETSNRLANATDNGSSDFQVTGQIDLKSKNTQGDGGQLGAELLTTGTGDASWTGTSFATGYTHATGSVTTLTSALAPVINNLYQVAYTVTGRTAGSFTIAFGGATTAGITSSSAVGHRASTTGTLVITPTSDFNGTIVLSIKQITAGTASFVFRDNGGVIRNELRILGGSNTANGVSALLSNTTGVNNTANGVSALLSNTTGDSNTANGVSALLSNTTGVNNTANGVSALLNNTTGVNNTANGVYALLNNTTGSLNTASGVYALSSNTTGDSNTANGINAGRFISNGATSLTVANNSTFLGANTKALSDNSTNETVVGYNAIGDGNNTVSIGNTSVVSSRLRGRFLQGNVVDNLIDSGQFSDNVLATGFKTASGTASQFLKANGSVDSNTYLTSASLPTVDQTIIDGSTNSVSGNAVFDGLALKSNIGHTHVASQITDLSKASVGLGNVDNTSDLSKPLSTATQTALNGKENSFTKNTAFNKNFGTTVGTVVEGGTLGSNAYNSIAYLPLSGGSLSGYLSLNDGNPLVLGDESTSRLRFITSNGVNYIQSGAGSGYGTRADLVITGNYGGNETVRFKDNGRILINKTDDDLTNQLQVAGTISASPATTANQVPTWGQVQAVARPYKVYTALLSQTGTNAPTATVLENTLGGTVVWSRVATGVYYGTLSGAFTLSKTWINIHASATSSGGSSPMLILGANPNTVNSVVVYQQYANTTSTLADSFPYGALEIRVYL